MARNIFQILAVAAILGGCSYLKLQEGVRHSAGDWEMYGGGAGRVNNAHILLKPPLHRVWEYDAAAGFSPYSAAAADSFLFVGNLQGEVHAIRISNGKRAGSHDFGSAIVGTPIVDGSMLYIPLAHDEESLVAYDVVYGMNAWKLKLGDLESSPLLVGPTLYVTSTAGKLYAIDKSKGTITWTFRLPPHLRTNGIHSSPASDGATVVFGSDAGNLYAVNGATGTLKWTARMRGSILATPSVAGGSVYVGSLDSTVAAFDLSDGHERWRRPLGAKIYGSQAVDEEHLYIGTAGRMLYCLRTADGTIAWSRKVGGIINSAPLVSGKVLYVGAIDKMLYAFNCETGDSLWDFQAVGRIKTMPIIYNHRLFVLSEDRSVIALEEAEK